MENILEKINRSAVKFLEPQTPINTYKTIVKEAIKLLGAEYGSILLEQNGELKRVYASIKMAYDTRNRKQGNTYESYSKMKAIIAPISEIGQHHPEILEYGIKWTVFIPLFYQKKPLGVLTLNTKKEEQLSKSELNTLKLFGSLASLAIMKTKSLDETQKALDTRDLFISLASHELKTPLTSVSGYIQLIKKKVEKSELPSMQMIENVSRETTRLTNLVKELLEINQVKSGSFYFKWMECRMKDIVQQAIAIFQSTNTKIHIIVEDNIKKSEDIFIGDYDKMKQVIINILQNAAKFSKVGDSIKVIALSTPDHISVTVIDQGDGISKKDLPNIFKDFYKGEGNQREGMGLGLFLSKHIMDSHKGQIKINSEEKKGTQVKLILPVAKTGRGEE